MTYRVIALVGLSGVGKSTLLSSLLPLVRFQHLQASALIKAERELLNLRKLSLDTLRNEDIGVNQQLLIAGFTRAIDLQTGIVVLDGHSVIDSSAGLVPIGATVFRALGVSRMVFLADDPAHISERRQADANRKRPDRTPSELRQQQEQALLDAFRISLELKVPLGIITPNHASDMHELLLTPSA